MKDFGDGRTTDIWTIFLPNLASYGVHFLCLSTGMLHVGKTGCSADSDGRVVRGVSSFAKICRADRCTLYMA